MSKHPLDDRFADYLTEQEQIEARARAAQGEATVRFFVKSAEAIRRAFRR